MRQRLVPRWWASRSWCCRQTSSACSTGYGPGWRSRSGCWPSRPTALRTLRERHHNPGQPRAITILRADFLLPATVLAGYVLLVTAGHAHLGRPIPALVLPLILFMGVHEYSLARGAAVAFVLGYATDVLGIAPVGLYTVHVRGHVRPGARARACGSPHRPPGCRCFS